MTRRPKTWVAGGVADPSATQHHTPAPVVPPSPSSRPERAPVRCEACGHVTIPALVCECGHIAEQHDLADDNQTRTVCWHSEGPKATRCECRNFTELTEGLPNA